MSDPMRRLTFAEVGERERAYTRARFMDEHSDGGAGDMAWITTTPETVADGQLRGVTPEA